MSVESKFENKYKNYKEEFTELLDEVVEGSLPVLPEMRAELDEVYAQAAKADDYEAKAFAFDRIKAYSDKAINGEMQSLELAEGITDVVEQYDIKRLSESGERNES